MTHYSISGALKGAPTIPIVLDSPHSGTDYPEDFDYAVNFMDLRQAEDTHVDKLYSFSEELGIPRLDAHFPRSYIDLNRSRFEIDEALLDEFWIGETVSTGKVKLGKGLVWRILDDGQAIYKRKLTVAEIQHRIDNYWLPYHLALSKMIARIHKSHGFVLHINCHSMPSVADRYSTDQPGLEHPDIVLGDRDGTSADHSITISLARYFRELGYSCWINQPYKGVELVRSYSDPAHGRHSIQIELNRRLYMDEESREINAGFEVLQAHLREILVRLIELVKSRVVQQSK